MVYYKHNDSMLLLETFVILEYNGIQQSRKQFDRVCSAILCKVDFVVSNTWSLLFIVVVHADSRTLLVQNFDYKLIVYGFIDYYVCDSYQNFRRVRKALLQFVNCFHGLKVISSPRLQRLQLQILMEVLFFCHWQFVCDVREKLCRSKPAIVLWFSPIGRMKEHVRRKFFLDVLHTCDTK